MRLSLSLAVIALISMVSFPAGAGADEASVPVELEAGGSCVSRYVSRGETLVDGGALQYNVRLKRGGLSFGIWSNYDTSVAKDLTELDYTLNQDLAFDAFTVSFGSILYTFPSLAAANRTLEIYGGMSFNSFLSPAVFVYYDTDEGDGTYYQASLTHSIPVMPFTVTLGTTLGYNDHQFRTASGWSDATANAAVSMRVCKDVQIALQVTESFSLDKEYYQDEFISGVRIDLAL